ncbi:hypothetical protein FIBSPDRAFT_854565 [Athelia psychrophila]|uniref:Uncharacterized protein n=1 Tax=Athelia psychrophila TaxID=1759441 RepID=A0A166Q7X1_9AGAM|nr:hypothetical protein FIBSPDRAFT_854565 [Fibularhizoctonia sp. CBS 109695]
MGSRLGFGRGAVTGAFGRECVEALVLPHPDESPHVEVEVKAAAAVVVYPLSLQLLELEPPHLAFVFSVEFAPFEAASRVQLASWLEHARQLVGSRSQLLDPAPQPADVVVAASTGIVLFPSLLPPRSRQFEDTTVDVCCQNWVRETSVTGLVLTSSCRSS